MVIRHPVLFLALETAVPREAHRAPHLTLGLAEVTRLRRKHTAKDHVMTYSNRRFLLLISVLQLTLGRGAAGRK